MFAIDKMDYWQLSNLMKCVFTVTDDQNLYYALTSRFDDSWYDLDDDDDNMLISDPTDPSDYFRCPLDVIKEELSKILSEMNLLGVLDQIILDALTMGDNYSWDNARAKLMERGYRMRLTPHLEKVKSL